MWFFLFLLSWLIACGIIASIASGREIGGVKGFWLSVFLSPLLGAIFVATSPRLQSDAPKPHDGNSNLSKQESHSAEFTGETDISNDAYKIWLVKSFQIEKNDTLNGFIMRERVYSSVDEALEAAHQLNLQIVSKRRAAEAKPPSQTLVGTGRSRGGREWKRFSDGTYEIETISGTKRRFSSLDELEKYIA
jgi:hypothetical protein